MTDFREALERESGASLATYWEAWVEGMGETHEGVTKRTRVEARFDLVIPQRVVEARHQLGEPLAKVTIDPDHRLLWLAAP
jgi:hypothetical protein